MSNIASENAPETIRFVRADSSSIVSPDALKTVWRIVGKDSGVVYGYVACSDKRRVSPSGKEYQTHPWGFALTVQEFQSGILFPYNSRGLAKTALFRNM